MIWEMYQQAKISEANQAAESAKSKADRTIQSIQDLEKHVERLALACQAMWELLRDGTELTEEDLEKKMSEVDGRDGKCDGRIASQLLVCPACGQNTNSKRSTCLMCGAVIKRPHAFEP